MPWVLATLKAIAAFPALYSAFKQLLGWLESEFGPDWPQRLEDLRSAAALWGKASTTKEREDAAKAMASAFNSRK